MPMPMICRTSPKVFLRGLLFSLSFLLMQPFQAQQLVPLSPWWVATVDDATQKIVLRWAPCPDTAILGYHICTGSPCIDYDTVFGRLDTTFFCLDHDPLEAHTYRLHVFNSAHAASPLTPYFGNIVLHGEMPLCASSVTARWNPYVGFPTGVDSYQLMVKLSPQHTDFEVCYTTDSVGPLQHTFDIPESTTQVELKVLAISHVGSTLAEPLVSVSNRLALHRQSVASSRYLDITSVCYDSILMRNVVSVVYDTDFLSADYTLWRSVDASPWSEVTTIVPPDTVCFDNGINPHDSLFCYKLSVSDACGLNEKFSDTLCMVIPDPPQPAIAIPNVLKIGDSLNGLFCPRIRGLRGTLYDLTIYNRLGLQIFHTTDPNECWDPAAYNPPLSQGSYAYRLRCQFNDLNIKTYTGTILILK